MNFLVNPVLQGGVKTESGSVVSESLWPHELYVHGILQARILDWSLSLLQGIFPTQGSNPGLPHCRRILYHLSYKAKPNNTGVGSLFLLQQIFPIQELNLDLLHYRKLSHIRTVSSRIKSVFKIFILMYLQFERPFWHAEWP